MLILGLLGSGPQVSCLLMKHQRRKDIHFAMIVDSCHDNIYKNLEDTPSLANYQRLSQTNSM